MASGSAFQYGLAYLIPAFRAEGLSLQQAGVLVACPTVGVVLTLIAWGAAADRWGERVVLTVGLGVAGLITLVAASVSDVVGLGVCLTLVGASGASVLASGRLILRWFARHERALAMGIRQSAAPLGQALAAATLPALGANSTRSPLVFLGVLFLASSATALAFVRDPAEPPPPSSENAPSPAASSPAPYRTPYLWRVHTASALLIIPQFTITTFALVFLTEVSGWSALAAGQVLAGAQACGALGRLGAGYWSDRTGSRMKPMRVIAVATGAGVLALAAAAALGSGIAVPLLLVLGVVAVSTNGLSFTAVAEHAGTAWAGRALGVQTTGQNSVAAATPPVVAMAIASFGFAPSYAVAGVIALVGALLVPVTGERGAARRANPESEPAEPALSR
ncbi:MAG: MFS transporter [Hamadaea sp.]|nr:MFS transporter [Hamadaea sp.]